MVDKKKQVINAFKKKLLASNAGSLVKRIILYGSVARGEADEKSDIDLLIFSHQPKKIEDTVDEISFNLMMETGEYIEPFIYPLEDYHAPKSYFVLRALETGRRII